MRVFVNGEPRDCDLGLTIADLIERHRLVPETTLVEQNGIALPRREWKNRSLRENDRLEILSVASGG
jgi:thiamine biosynthesis protein ThiS